MIGVYCIRNKVNDKRYIGQSIDVKNRMWHHKDRLNRNVRENGLLQDDWNEFGEESFEFSILEECERKYLDEQERYWIAYYKTTERQYGYNHESGGISGFTPDNESVQKTANALKGKYVGENSPRFGKPGKKHTEEWINWAKQRFSGEGNPMYGIHLILTEEQKKHLSEINAGSGNGFYGKRHSEQAKNLIGIKNGKPVRCVETGMVYRSAKEAGRMVNICPSGIERCCKGQAHTAASFHWEYAT